MTGRLSTAIGGWSSFRFFWLGQIVSQFGDRIHVLAVLWLVYHWTGSGLVVGTVMIAASLPAILIAPFAGALVDRWDCRGIMIAADGVRAVVAAGLAASAWSGTLDLHGLIAATVLLSLGAALFNPAALALVPAIVPPSDLTRANALVQTSVGASGVIGPLVGGGLVAFIGVPLAFAANALSFAVSGLLIAAIGATPRSKSHAGSSLLAETRAGLRLVRDQPLLRRLLVPVVVCNFFFAGLMMVIPVLAGAVFGRGAFGMGMMTSAYMLGMLLGAVALSALRLRLPPGRLIVGSMAGMGLGMVAIGAVPVFPVALAGLAVVGFALSLGNIVLVALFQEHLPPADRGKVFGLVTALALSQQPLAFGLMGILTETVPVPYLLIVCGIATALAGLGVLRAGELMALRSSGRPIGSDANPAQGGKE